MMAANEIPDSGRTMNTLSLLSIAVAAALAGCNSNEPPAAAPAASTPGVQAMAVPPATEVLQPAAVAQPPQEAPGLRPRVAPSYGNAPPYPVAAPPAPPSADARWTGGYWIWHDNWVWAPGRWAEPPRPQYHWEPPYYEHRRDRVVFVDGFWAPPGRSFVPPPSNLAIALAVIGAGIAHGRPPVGPEGVFVPPPPGSRRGLIVPAPIGTAPAVMTSAPPIIAPGMRVTTNVTNIGRVTNNKTTIVNEERNSTVVNNVTNVTIEAPANSTASHRPVHVSVPGQAHLAAALPPVERTRPVASVAAPPVTAPAAQPGLAAPPA